MLAVPSVPAGAGSGSHDALAIIDPILVSSDSDQDRILTAVEYEREGLGSFGVTFAGIDADADGLLTLEDYVEPYERHHDSHDQSDA